MKTSTIKIERWFMDEVSNTQNILEHCLVPERIYNLKMFCTKELLVVEFNYDDPDEPECTVSVADRWTDEEVEMFNELNRPAFEINKVKP